MDGQGTFRLHPRQPTEWGDIRWCDLRSAGSAVQASDRNDPGFAGKYEVYRLVHYEAFADMDSAIAREKQLKAWRRAWKVALIEKDNPFWEDRAVELGFDPVAPHPASVPPAKPSSQT